MQIYYLAKKKIPSIHGNTMGVKLQQFIFDAFPYAPSTALFEMDKSWMYADRRSREYEVGVEGF
ncbi:N-acetylglucosamine-1-phosphate uridylyltransferase 1 [Prunus dulcis]|uniref:N-acetylglucosamine-1-phosphate uridylyltransferase 1 n=1 Tax=Prunus dulcis TaxID=3755 RepID=A0A5H2XMF5_PRUDU|nr:N-acetylglucosamine-1-phosphate uridylyltransferase 1 [Prunus dulcis]